MDIASLVIGLPPLIAGFWKVAQSINTVCRQFASTPAILGSLEIQCRTLINALELLKSPTFSDALQGSGQQEQILQLVNSLVTLCQGGLSKAQILVQDLQEQQAVLSTGASRNNEILLKVKAVWNGGRIEELVDQMRGFESNIGTLLIISQSYSLESIRRAQISETEARLLDSHSSATRPASVSIDGYVSTDLATSRNSLDLSFISDLKKVSTTTLYLNHRRVVPADLQFDFDQELYNTRTYRRTLAKNAKPEISQQVEEFNIAETPPLIRSPGNVSSNIQSELTQSLPPLSLEPQVHRKHETFKHVILGNRAFRENTLFQPANSQSLDKSSPKEEEHKCIYNFYSITESSREVKTVTHLYTTEPVDLKDTDIPVHQRPAHCFLLIYEVGSRDSLERLKKNLTNLSRSWKSNPMTVLLVGIVTVSAPWRWNPLTLVAILKRQMLGSDMKHKESFKVAFGSQRDVARVFTSVIMQARRFVEEREAAQ